MKGNHQKQARPAIRLTEFCAESCNCVPFTVIIPALPILHLKIMAKATKKKSSPGSKTIALNKQARHDYYIEQTFEAGLVLQGWEVKSLRDGRIQMKESYVIMEKGEAFLFGAHISALLSASTHVIPDSVRTRKLLLHGSEIVRINNAVDR